jgi:hypothetical protein
MMKATKRGVEMRKEETDRIIRYLRAHEKGTFLSYDDLSRAIGSAERLNAQHSRLRSAMKTLRDTHLQVWICERPDRGVRRLNDAEIVERAQRSYAEVFEHLRRFQRLRRKKEAHTARSANEQAEFAVDSLRRELVEEMMRGLGGKSYSAAELAQAIRDKRER